MITSLFCYGTLQEKTVFETVSGLSVQSQSASLEGYKRFRVARADYPGIIPCDVSNVQGLVWHSIDLLALRKLDAFEGPFYQRKIVTIVTGDHAQKKAWAYVFAPNCQHLITDEPWELDNYRAAFLKRFSLSPKRF